jgi:hypothetical protein
MTDRQMTGLGDRETSSGAARVATGTIRASPSG